MQNAARTLGKQLLILNARTGSEIDTGFATLAQQRAHALFVVADAFMTTRREHIVALAARHALPAIYSLREFAAAGRLGPFRTIQVSAKDLPVAQWQAVVP